MNTKKRDIVLLGATFFCGKGLKDDVDYLWISGNKIKAMGKSEDLAKISLEDKEIYTFDKNKLIMPGFYEGHTHIITAGMTDKYPNFGKCKSEDETARMAAAYAEANPDEEWIFGFNWYPVYWGQTELPTAKSLDKYIPNRPAMLVDAEAHGVWVNSAALEMCGITKETKDPPFGEICRYENGDPTGFFHEMAIGLIAGKAFAFPKQIEMKFISDYMKKAVKVGITGASDMLPYYGNDMGTPARFSEMEKNDQMIMRIHSAPDVLGNLEDICAMAKKYNGEKYQIKLLKEFVDGVPTTYTSLMLEPFNDNPKTFGSTLTDPENLKKAIEQAHAKGMSVRLHCCGDGAVRYALECFESANQKYGDTGARHGIEHFETTTPKDIAKCAELKVLASIQPEHLAMTDEFEKNPYLDRYNERQKKYSWPIKSIMDAGVVVLFGSDCPVVDNNPITGIYRAVTRLHNDGNPEGGWNPEQKITMEEALHAYTYCGQFSVKREYELGTLEVGKLADLVVLNQNLLKIPNESIRDTKVLITMVDGEIVYRA